ncbi:MAG TPA: POTRA domain-containing protein [Candidatus Acidoferrum sp.]|nr:POTRA domain-containing protein [Candidatus Acidoferrum sp.]
MKPEVKPYAKIARVAPSLFRAAASVCLLLRMLCGVQSAVGADAAGAKPASQAVGSETNGPVRFAIRAYEVRGDTLLTNYPAERLLEYTGTNVTIADLVKAASRLQREHFALGASNLSIAIARERITNGVVTINVFRSRIPRLLISGKYYELAPVEPAGQASVPGQGTVASAAGATTQTNVGPRFTVRHYEIRGDTLLSMDALTKVLLKYTGTNLGLSDIEKAASDLQMEYRARGFPTVIVRIPEQRLTNDIVKFRVVEGRLSDIAVLGNRYFSSNNVMRSLPGLHTNMIITAPVFQAELDRANANQDRQIYPQIQPGESPNTTELLLKVKDRLPLHAKMEFNNQSSPGTPDLRINTSAVYNNLWQYEHSLGVQYSFSPEAFKTGNQWNLYDLPLVANYSAFYRLPLGNPTAIASAVGPQPGSFGFNEATRQFQLPPPSGTPELNLFGSRSTIDTGLETLQNTLIYNVPGVRQVSRQDVQQDLTLTEDVGLRLSEPLSGTVNWRSTISGGLDFKTYSLTDYKTNRFSFTEITVNADGSVNPPIISTVASPVPTTHTPLDYAPVSLRYDGSLRDKLGTTAFGLGLNVNAWYSGSLTNLRNITGSLQSKGNWVTLIPSFSRDFDIYTNWVLTLRADGQWASEPLISVERFGAGGVNSVRGYQEGEVFGDTGWHVSLEQKTPAHIVGFAYSKTPLILRGSIYMDYAETYLLDPNGAKGRVSLWGTGVGGIFSLGSHWEARFLFSVPLLKAGTTDALQPRFNFSLLGQF